MSLRSLSFIVFMANLDRYLLLQELRHLLARVEHARFHGRLRDADDLGDFLHRLLVVVDEVDDLPVLRRQRGQALPQNRALSFFARATSGSSE